MASFDRAAALERLAAEQFDVLVIGGGHHRSGGGARCGGEGIPHGAGRGSDFASGTSSKSSKMVHGGIRYLQQREFRLVYENLAERQRLLENAPHLVSPLPFVIPLFGHRGAVSKAVTRSFSVALWLYDLTGGVRIGRRHRRLSQAEVLRHLPSLRTDRLVAGFLYFDARADDARLTLAVARTAALDYGAVVANYAPVVELCHDAGRISGAVVHPVGADPLEVRARAVVNATGVWAGGVAALDAPGAVPSLRPAKGIHVTVPASRFPADIAATIPVREDRRVIFVVPWPEVDMVYLGTTDTGYEGPLDQPACTPEDVDYLLRAANAVTTTKLTPADVTGAWVGLRPLLAPDASHAKLSERTSDLSRRHSVTTSPQGLVTVTGGKLTTYRKMAQDTVDRVVELLDAGPRRAVTQHLRLRGAPTDDDGVDPPAIRAPVPLTVGTDPCDGEGEHQTAASLRSHLWGRYGTEATEVLRLAEGCPELLRPVVEGLPYVGAEVLYAAREEMAQTLDDVLARRTRALIQDAAGAADAAPRVASLVAPVLGWDPERAATAAREFAESARRDLERATATVASDGDGPPPGAGDAAAGALRVRGESTEVTPGCRPDPA